MAVIALWRTGMSTDVGFWRVALPFLAQGLVMPFYFVPTTSIVMSSVPPEEMASAAGLSNFLRTSSAAFAVSLMTTAWDNIATAKRTELAGRLHDAPGVLASLGGRGLSPDQALGRLEQIVQQQAVMLATNQLFLISSVLLLFAASIIWLAPKPHPSEGPAGGH
jgi:DHA2 family multidrug resistance protein